MLFSVIYSFDCPAHLPIKPYQPPQLRKLWEMTEREDNTCAKQRKYCAILTRKQFEAFIDHCDLYASTVETMGSIGAPGFGFGWAPAISFESSNDRYVGQNAYVTPVPSLSDIQPEVDVAARWNRVKQAVIAVYGESGTFWEREYASR